VLPNAAHQGAFASQNCSWLLCSEMLGIRRLSRTKTRDAGRPRHRVHHAVEAKPAQTCDFPASTGITLTSSSAIGTECEHNPPLASTTRAHA